MGYFTGGCLSQCARRKDGEERKADKSKTGIAKFEQGTPQKVDFTGEESKTASAGCGGRLYFQMSA
jgi:hypothetical protein